MQKILHDADCLAFCGSNFYRSELQFHTKKLQGCNDWGKKAVSEILATESLLIKSAEVGYLTYYVFFTKALMGRFCGMAELLGNFQHNDQALLNYGLDFFQMDA